jgi:hypothetical protein
VAVVILLGEFVFKEQFKGYVVCLLYKYSFFFGFQKKENWGLGGPITMRWGGGLVKEALTLYENLLLTFLVFPHSQ